MDKRIRSRLTMDRRERPATQRWNGQNPCPGRRTSYSVTLRLIKHDIRRIVKHHFVSDCWIFPNFVPVIVLPILARRDISQLRSRSARYPTSIGRRTEMKLLEQVRAKMRLLHYSWDTEECYVRWIERYICFHKVGGSPHGRSSVGFGFATHANSRSQKIAGDST